MKKLIALSLTAFAASTAFAQVQDSSTAAPAPAGPAPTTSVAPAPAQPDASVQPSVGADGSATTQAQAAPAPAANASTQVAAVVDAGFPKYDLDHDGKLSPAEFKQWISDLKTSELASEGKPANAAAVQQYASSAWKAADKNGDKSVSKTELTSFLGG